MISKELHHRRGDIFTAARLNNTGAVYKFLEYELNDPNELNDDGISALHICATHGSLECAVILLEYGCDLNLRDKESGWTALHRSIYFRHFKLTWLLIRSGAVLDVGYDDLSSSNNSTKGSIKDNEGFTPLALLSSILSNQLKKRGETHEINRGCVFAYGKADFQLGVALPKSLSDIIRPRYVNFGQESIITVAANKFHSLALSDDGVVYSWGHGRGGRLGHGDEITMPEPTAVTSLIFRQKIREISAGQNHSLALTIDGELYTWGSDRFGQLGHGGSETGKLFLHPKKVELLRREHVVGIAAGDSHSACFTSAGEIYAFGSGKSGQLGLKPSEMSSTSGVICSTIPKRVRLPIQQQKNSTCLIHQISASFSCTLVIAQRPTSKLNEVFQWGNGMSQPSKVHFELTRTNESIVERSLYRLTSKRYLHLDGHTVGVDHQSTRLMFGEDLVNIVTISAGKYHNVGVTDQGHVYTWGLGCDQLGHSLEEAHSSESAASSASPSSVISNGTSSPRLVESLLEVLSGGKISHVSAASNRSCVLSESGDLYTWGATTDQGVLSAGKHGAASKYEPIPKIVHGIKRAVQVALGDNHTLVLSKYSIPPFLPLSDIFEHPKISLLEATNSGAQNKLLIEDENSDDDEESDHLPTRLFHESDLRGIKFRAGRSASLLSTREIDEVPSLRSFCERSLAKAVDLKNVINMLSQSEMLYAPLLEKYCSDFINRNLDMILIQSKPSDLDGVIEDFTFPRVIETLKDQNIRSSGSFSAISSPPQFEKLSARTLIKGRSGSILDSAGLTDGSMFERRNSFSSDRRDRSGSLGSNNGYVLEANEFTISSHSRKNDRLTQNLESSESVGKLIRAAKKKLSSIDELQAKIRTEGGADVHGLCREQINKIERKSALESELHRLTLIFNRLESEERILAKAKLAREADFQVALMQDQGVSCTKCDSKSIDILLEPPTKFPEKSSSAITASGAPTTKVQAMTNHKPTNNSIPQKLKKSKFVSLNLFEEKSKCSTITSTSESLKSPPFVSYEAYAALIETKSPATTHVQSHPERAGPPLSWASPSGRTVLSPPSSTMKQTTILETTPNNSGTKGSSSLSVTKMNSNFPSSVSEPTSRAVNRRTPNTISQNGNNGTLSGVPNDSPPSKSGFSLASFIPSGKKGDNKQLAVASPTKPTSISSGGQPAAPPSAWKVYDNLSHTDSIHHSPQPKKSFQEIQQLEEVSRKLSNISTLSGNDNPWYVERRARAPSLDEVIKSEIEEKLALERAREEEHELELALKAVAAAEIREKLQAASNSKASRSQGKNFGKVSRGKSGKSSTQ